MKVQIFGDTEESKTLVQKVKVCLDELGLVDFVQVEETTDTELQKKLDIKKSPALIIVEESIDFQDTIFEGMVPENEELKSMFISIVGGESGGSCGKKDDSGSCGTGCDMSLIYKNMNFQYICIQSNRRRSKEYFLLRAIV